MAYNQGLAVGLAVGLPCFIVFVGALFFYRRNRRLQRKEDQEGDALDVEMGENGLFKEFGEALHKPAATPSQTRLFGGNSPLKSHADTTMAKLLTSGDSVKSASVLNLSKTHSLDRRKLVQHFPELYQHRPQGQPHGLPHGKSNSAYDFYDTVIPILPLDPDLQPPTNAGSGLDRQSVHSSRGSLLHGDQTRSLESLAKQLQNPQFFEKLPSRASTTLARPQRAFVSGSKSSSQTDLLAPYAHGGINDHFVNETTTLQEQPLVHPYRERIIAHQMAHQEAALKQGMGLESNFDNNITAETGFSSQPDVVFK